MSLKKKDNLMNNELQYKELDLDSVFCIACRCIYIRPVTMPCKHTLCLECFKNMVNLTAYHCPICRKRISNWLRKFKNNWDVLVNEHLWEAIQQQYPTEVHKKLNDEDDSLDERISGQSFTRVQNQEGELKEEFDKMRMNYLKEQEQIELQNLKLAKQLEEEEEANRRAIKELNEKITQEDEKLALTIQKKLLNELDEEQILLNESDGQLAQQLQNMETTLHTGVNKINNTNNTLVSKKTISKEGPLDKIFSTLTSKNNETHELSKKSISDPSPSLTSSSSFQPSSTCTSPNSFIGFSANELLESFKYENENCICVHLDSNANSEFSRCKYCISLLEIQQKKDFMMAKELENQFKMEDATEYNLRKRSNSIQYSQKKKIKKLSKGQQTLNFQVKID